MAHENERVNLCLRIGSGGGCIVGSAVDSNTRGPGFESTHRQLISNNYLLFAEKTKIDKRRPGMPI